MGFYAPAQIVRDAREHKVEVRPACINNSYWDNVMEPDAKSELTMRLGFRQIKAMREEEATWISSARGNGYQTVEDVWRRAGTSPRLLYKLAEADAFTALGLNRREAQWQARAITSDEPLPLFARELGDESIDEPRVSLPDMSEGEHVVEDYVTMRLTLRSHPLALLRNQLTPARPAQD